MVCWNNIPKEFQTESISSHQLISNLLNLINSSLVFFICNLFHFHFCSMLIQMGNAATMPSFHLRINRRHSCEETFMKVRVVLEKAFVFYQRSFCCFCFQTRPGYYHHQRLSTSPCSSSVSYSFAGVLFPALLISPLSLGSIATVSISPQGFQWKLECILTLKSFR